MQNGNGALASGGDSGTQGFELTQTMLRVRDPQRSLAFYRDVLGMTLLDRFDFPDMKFSLYFLGYRQPGDAALRRTRASVPNSPSARRARSNSPTTGAPKRTTISSATTMAIPSRRVSGISASRFPMCTPQRRVSSRWASRS